MCGHDACLDNSLRVEQISSIIDMLTREEDLCELVLRMRRRHLPKFLAGLATLWGVQNIAGELQVLEDDSDVLRGRINELALLAVDTGEELEHAVVNELKLMRYAMKLTFLATTGSSITRSRTALSSTKVSHSSAMIASLPPSG